MSWRLPPRASKRVLIRSASRGFSTRSIRSSRHWAVRARRAMAHEPPLAAAVQLVRRNRRRWGGYLVHLGIAVLSPRALLERIEAK